VHLVGGWSGGKRVEQHSDDSWRQMIDLNLTSAFLCCRAVLPGMRKRDRGRIVLVSSRTAERERGGQVAYAIAKVGVEVLAQTIAEENKDANVTANVIAPSTLDTPANLAAMPDGDRAKWVTPQDVARSVAFLASDAPGPRRGARRPIYGGGCSASHT
jgi:NAD(P)-dependent dehydrogenase (short-subunit alcohol dehydrogenase family)